MNWTTEDGERVTQADILKEAGRIAGRKKSKRKAKASADNGKKGGRPRKPTKQKEQIR